jgi:hypothetical protein
MFIYLLHCYSDLLVLVLNIERSHISMLRSGQEMRHFLRENEVKIFEFISSFNTCYFNRLNTPLNNYLPGTSFAAISLSIVSSGYLNRRGSIIDLVSGSTPSLI